MPRPSQGLVERIEIKVTDRERRAYQQAAAVESTTLSEWLRRVANRESGLLERRMRQAAEAAQPTEQRKGRRR